ncbi:MAG: RNA polymerase sporulation sigma factor SigK [Clostridiales bacterium]|nr:RNA polymerase sporulation sigma factor SigK [Clostridiales bacterium]
MKTFPTPLSLQEEADCLKRLRQGDPSAREELILHNMRLVAHVAKKYSVSEEDPEDLISIGTIGLIKAVGTFNPDYGSRFATYAISCINNEVLMHMRLCKKRRGEVSMYDPVGTDKEGNQLSIIDTLEQEDDDVAERLGRQSDIRKVLDSLPHVLDERESYIIRRRYGLLGEEELTQRQIASELGISRSYVSRIEKKALEKLRGVLK